MKALHDRIKDLPLEIQGMIVTHAMGQYISSIDNDDWLEAYEKWRDSDSEVDLYDLGIYPWEPFEHYDNEALWDEVDSAIYSLSSFAREIFDYKKGEPDAK